MTISIIPLPDPNAPASVGGPDTSPQRVVTTSGPIVDSERVLDCQQTTPITLDLPASAVETDTFIIVDSLGVADVNPITITAPGSSLINGLSTYPLNVPFRAVRIGRLTSTGDFFIF